jgi:hypothetical protein
MESDISRRSVLGAGAAALAAVPLAAAVPPAEAAVRRKLVIGASEGWFTKVHAAVPAVSCRRVYISGYNDIPHRWPSTRDARTTLVSVRPVPADLLAGRLDSRIRAFLRTAPPGSDLTAWHEAGNLPGYPSYLTAPAMRAVHAHMHRLCRHTHVRYGPILCMHPLKMGPWMVPGLDWYGLDIYDWPEFRHSDGTLNIDGALYPRLDQWRAVIRHLTKTANPALNICETNSSRVDYRPQWFTAVARWMSRNGGHRMLTYWSHKHNDAGPWRPGDTAVIRSLARAAALDREHAG